LRAMLSCKSRGVDAMCLPWIRHVRADMHALQVFHAPRLDELGDPGLHSEAWCSLMFNFPSAWSELVSALHILDLSEDFALGGSHLAPHSSPIDLPTRPYSHFCEICLQKNIISGFSSSKALRSHMRVAHKVRNPLRVFLDGSGRCPVCCVEFRSRTRCLAHVSESRCRGKSRVTCRSILEGGTFQPLPPHIVATLDEDDRCHRRSARASGRSQPLTEVPAKRARIRGQPASDIAYSNIHIGNVLICKPARRLCKKTRLIDANLQIAPLAKKRRAS